MYDIFDIALFWLSCPQIDKDEWKYSIFISEIDLNISITAAEVVKTTLGLVMQ